jgi:hypothetical protein
MNHIPYEIARMRQDDLRRVAAKRRLATSVNGEPSVTLGPRPGKLRRLWWKRHRRLASATVSSHERPASIGSRDATRSQASSERGT